MSQRWGIVVSTYGRSEQRLTHTLKFLRERTAVPFDLYVRGAGEDYWQIQTQRHTASKFGAQFHEDFRWRHYGPSLAFQCVTNEYLGYFKDDIVVGHNWLEAIDYFWTHNDNVPIAQVGLSFIEAWELVSIGHLKTEDDMWKGTVDITRDQLMSAATIANAKVHSHVPHVLVPILSLGSCPFAWTLKRKDFFDFEGPYYVGPGDNSNLWGALAAKHEKISFMLPYPVTVHRRQQSTSDYLNYHAIASLSEHKGKFWFCEQLHQEFKSRWRVDYQQVLVQGNEHMKAAVAKHHVDLDTLKFRKQDE